MHVAAPTTEITHFIRLSPTFTKLTMQTVEKKKCQALSLSYPLSHQNKDLRKRVKHFRNDMPVSHAADKQSLLKEKLPFFPAQLFQMLMGYKK